MTYNEQIPPTVNDLWECAESSLSRRIFARYLLAKNPERSVRRHRFLGAPLVRKIVMSTAGRDILPGNFPNNYHRDLSKPKLDASIEYALGGSVFNEMIHAVASIPSAMIVLANISEGNLDRLTAGTTALNAAAAGINLSLVSLQRYNRARMIVTANEELANGETFQPYYTNDFGIDATALSAYHAQAQNEPVSALERQPQLDFRTE